MSRIDADAMARYELARDRIVSHLTALESLLPEKQRSALNAARSRLERGKFVLAIVGEFSSGKSFLLNTLLGKFRYEEVQGREQIVGLLATDINPSTATITELEYAPEDEAWSFYEDGRSERIPLDRLSNFVAVAASTADAGAVHGATEDDKGAPVRVVVKVNSPFLQRGFIVADTPGLASVNPAHRRATLQFLPSADAVLYLIDTQQPFTEGDASFLGIVRRYIDSIFIVQTKIDLWNRRQADGKLAWESAHDRIAQLAAVHAPGTYVYALSAREYAAGVLQGDAQAIEESRFGRFLEALDASLIKNTGRSRLRHAGDRARTEGNAARALIERERAMLALAPAELHARRMSLLPDLERLDRAIASQRGSVESAKTGRTRMFADQENSLIDDLERALTQAFDTTDIARLRDRARLHILVDRTFAQVAGDFAAENATAVTADLDERRNRAQALLAFRFDLTEAAARAFGATPGASVWRGEVAQAIAATVVLDAIGGPAIEFVHDVARKFAGTPPGAYMKRELNADLRETIFPRLRPQIRAFVADTAMKIGRMYDAFAQDLTDAALERRDGEIGTIDRAIAQSDPAVADAQLHAAHSGIETLLAEIEGAVDAFMAHENEIAPADAGPEAIRRAHSEQFFDREAYGRGLRPQRWRVCVLGALRRGKSSLINTIAGRRVLADETAGTIAYPVHVRYGEQEQAFALQDDGQWRETEIESTLDEATRNPVLVLVPWKLPRELVLVHAPAFDTGDSMAEDICIVSASASSEVLCLFSRQLSDRELALYERVAELGKSMIFAHTIADNESASERRHVVELAQRYLQEHNIEPSRIFTISTLEYARAKREGRAPAGWNELDALIATLEGHAEAHMSKLARLERAAQSARQSAATREPAKPSLFARLFGK
ncbi:MAG: dynamin family protein [Candidatus Eremiobacteraeota bacterium]|nr:dynamin family protein [Candidatus Eremiobacteraeota bacterium]